MNEEVSLKDVIRLIIKGKWIIAGTTALVFLLTVLLSYFYIPSTYQSTSLIRISVPQSESADKELLNSLTESIQSDVSINKIINGLGLEGYGINSLRKNLKVGIVQNTKIVEVTFKASDRKIARKIANYVAFEMAARFEVTDRSNVIVNSKSKLLAINDSIALLEKEISEIEKQLKATPEKLITKKTLVDEPFLHSVVNDSIRNSGDSGVLQYTSEEINPLYTALKSQFTGATISLAKLEEEKNVHSLKIEENQKIIQQLDTKINDETLALENSQRLLDGFNAVFVSPAVESTKPIGPNKILNLFLGLVVGFMIGVLIVFFKHYWTQDNQTRDIRTQGVSL